MENTIAVVIILVACFGDVFAQNGTLVDNSTSCDRFATRTTYNASYDLCECDSDFSGNGTTCELEPLLDCSNDESDGYAFKVYLNQSYIDYNGYTQESLVLLNESCGNATLEDGYYVITADSFDGCGSIVSDVNDTISYANAVQSTGGLVTSGDTLYIPIACIVGVTLTIGPRDGNDSVPIRIDPDSIDADRIVFPVVGAQGTTKAAMYLYRDSSYSTGYNGIPVLTTSDVLYVEVALEKRLNNIHITAEECWASPDASGTGPNRFNLIQEPGCLNTQALSAGISSNGVTSHARFHFQVFRFMDADVVYMHCNIELCSPIGGRVCQPSCNSKRRRRRSSEKKAMVSSIAIIRAPEDKPLQPISNTGIVEEGDKRKDSQGYSNATLLAIIVTLTAVLVLGISGIVIYFCVTRKRKTFKPIGKPAQEAFTPT